jgi:hypothetical protein
MENKNIKAQAVRTTVAFCFVYALIWVIPGIVVYPVDSLIELTKGIRYVDSWTPGLMVWTGIVVVIPILYVFILLGILSVERRRERVD